MFGTNWCALEKKKTEIMPKRKVGVAAQGHVAALCAKAEQQKRTNIYTKCKRGNAKHSVYDFAFPMGNRNLGHPKIRNYLTYKHEILRIDSVFNHSSNTKFYQNSSSRGRSACV
jgi:hypothetical protein